MTPAAANESLRTALAGIKALAGTCRMKAAHGARRGARPHEVSVPIVEWERLMAAIDRANVHPERAQT